MEWNHDKAPRHGAALAYYTVFSIAPLLVIVIAVAGLVFGQQAAEGRIIAQIQELVGQQGAQFIQTLLQNARKPSSSIVASIIGVVTLLIGALGVFGQLQDSLNTIWEVQPKEGRGIIGVIKDRFLSFAMVLGTAFLLLVSLVISAALTAFDKYFDGRLPMSVNLLQTANFFISLGVVTALFAIIFKYLPDAKIRWRDVWMGAMLTALLFTIGKFLLGIYIGHGSFGSTYGAAGSLVIVLAWVYYSAQVLFFGAEFIRVYACRHGAHIKPRSNAIRLTKEERAHQGIPSACPRKP